MSLGFIYFIAFSSIMWRGTIYLENANENAEGRGKLLPGVSVTEYLFILTMRLN